LYKMIKLNSFKNALKGLKKVFKEEKNFQFHVIIAIIVVLLSIYWQLAAWQWIIILLLITLILVLEIINTIIERFIDILKPRIHSYVKDIKDMSAAMVMVSTIAAVIIGLIVFLPYII